MPNLPRVTAKIYANNAAETDIAQFGSVITGSVVYTPDIAQIQALPAYETGWRAAVISDENYPTLVEFNGLQKTFSQQIAYILQKGIPEWDEATTYYANTSFCQVNGVIYKSLTNDNTGHNPVDDTTNWAVWAPWGGDFANINLSNITSEANALISSLAIPDYKNGVDGVDTVDTWKAVDKSTYVSVDGTSQTNNQIIYICLKDDEGNLIPSGYDDGRIALSPTAAAAAIAGATVPKNYQYMIKASNPSIFRRCLEFPLKGVSI